MPAGEQPEPWGSEVLGPIQAAARVGVPRPLRSRGDTTQREGRGQGSPRELPGSDLTQASSLHLLEFQHLPSCPVLKVFSHP